ncbi:MAG: hypothetical protein WBD12_00595, partial [Candidatus Omnitrophota bacterium]
MGDKGQIESYNKNISLYRGFAWARYKKLFKIFTWLLIFIFVFEQSGFTGDRVLHKYNYSPAKDLLTGEKELKQMGRMSMPYLIRAQKKHEEIIRTKNLIEDDAILFLNTRSKVDPLEDNMPLKKKAASDGSPEKRIEYTLSDYDESGNPQQISVYAYGSDGATLKKVISYDIRDMSAGQWLGGDLEEISEEDDPKVMGSFEKGDYEILTDELAIKTVVYFGKESEEKIDYVLSGYRQGKPEEVSLYTYGNGQVLKEVNTYDVSSMASGYSMLEWKGFIGEREDEWKLDVEAKGRLTRKAVYEGSSGEEKLVYALSEYDENEAPGRIDCYDYDGGKTGPLGKTRAYNIKGVDIGARLSDFRENLSACDEKLSSTTIYKGKEDKEIVDYVLGNYYLDGAEYKPARRTDYLYDENGRLNMTKTYCIKSGANILRQCSEFRGLRGKEIITRSYDYEIDGTTLYSVSLYEYELDPDADEPHIGGDGNKYTLDRVVRYVDAVDPHDLASAKVKEESYFDGPENDEYITYSFGFDVINGDTVIRKEYVYDGKKLDEVNIYRTDDVGRSYDVGDGTKITYMDYSGLEGQEKINDAVNYDLAGQVLSRTAYRYGTSGALQETVTSDSLGIDTSRTAYEGAENQEKRTLTESFDLTGNKLTFISYEYDLTDALQKSTTKDINGIKVSETLYRGIKNNEKASSQTKFDLSGSIIGTVEYQYDAGDALAKIVSKDEDGRKLSEVSHLGPENYEKAVRSEQFDLAEGLLTATDYAYNSSGALEKTITEGFIDEGRGEWRKFSETIYSGRMSREKVEEVISYDYLGDKLTTTEYYYRDNGAITRTVTTDSNGSEISETIYSGGMNFEKVDHTRSFDLEGAVLTTSRYEYSTSGALSKTEVYDYLDRKISASRYEGSMGRERITGAEGYNLAGDKLNATIYAYRSDGALSTTTTYDPDNVRLSETEFYGLMNRERSDIANTFDDKGENIESSTNYLYGPSGALTQSITRDNGGKLLAETFFSGIKSREKNHTSRSYDSSEALENITHYSYGDDGALVKTRTNESDDETLLSETYYYGLSGYEVSDFTLNYREDGTVRNSTYYFYTSFDQATSTYLTSRAEGAFREDPLVRAETYEGGTESGDLTGLLLQSVAYYKGGKNKEIIDFSQEYEFKPDDDTQRQIKSTIIYEYDDKRALVASYTYSGGHEASKDTTGLKRSYLSRYEGERGEEQIYYMEGTTCEYYMEDYTEWDFFIRTGFTYDDEGRNTGYFEKITSPDTEWDWSVETDGVIINAQSVSFSEFDEKDRYCRIEKIFFDWEIVAGAYDFTETDRKVIQESFEYDADDNITSYLETNIDPEEETRRYKFTFEGYTDKKPATTISWELDENYQQTGDYFKKSGIEYDEYARITRYVATSCSDAKTSISEIFDIAYDKDLVISEKVRTEGEFFYFGADYSLREYKYNPEKRVETTVLTNGDYISISNSEGRSIYFEWTPEMAPYREQDFVSLREPEGAGPRTGSQVPSSPVADVLGEIRKCAAHDAIIQQTEIIYTEDGQINRITDTKGNVYNYSDNRLIELRDNADVVVATVDYQTAGGVLTVSMESVFDDISAVYTYNEDYRKLSVEVSDDSGTKKETFAYVKQDNGKIDTVTAYREFYEDGSLFVVDKTEKYDPEERLVGLFTRLKNDDARSYVAKWTGEYNSDDRLIDSGEIKCASDAFAFEEYSDDQILAFFDLFADRQFSGLSDADIQNFGNNDVLISEETWQAEYYEDGNIKNSSKNEETFKYEKVRNAINWPGTEHDYYRGYGPYSHDGNWGTPQYNQASHQNNRGQTDVAWCKTVHTFEDPITLNEINFHVQTYAHRSESGSCNSNWYVRICQDGEWETLWSDSRNVGDGADLNSGERVNIGSWSGVTEVEIYAYACSSGGRDGKAQVWIYELETGSPDTEQFKLVQLSDVTTDFFAGDGSDEREYYDEKNNIIKYDEVKTDHAWHMDINGNEIDEGTLVADTSWNALGVYDVDRVAGFSQTVHKTHPTASYDVSENIVRTDINYTKGNIVSYRESFITDATPDVITERVVTDMIYEYGKTAGFKEVTNRSGPGLDNTTINVREDMVYDGWGNLSSWTDLYTPDSSEYDISDDLRDLWEDDDTGLKDIFAEIDGPGSGEWEGKTIIDWALEIGYGTYSELEEYSPWERTTTVNTFDDKGRLLTYVEVETAFKDVAAGAPREEQIRTTERLRTIYSTPIQIKNLLEGIETIKVEDGSTVKEETVYKSNIVYNALGQEYSYTLYANDDLSHIDSSSYNSLGQLVETYTRIDASSYSRNYYYYDQAGSISQTKNYYYLHRETEESNRQSSYKVIEHYEKTVWYDKYGEKTSENINQYVDVQVISTNFWSDFFGRTIISVISAVLSAIPYIGWALSIALNSGIALANGTFDLLSLGTQLLSAGIGSGFGGLLGFSPMQEMLKVTPLGEFQNLWGGIGLDEFTSADYGSFERFLFDAQIGALQAVVSEGVTEVGRENDWGTFLTSAVASFSSAAIGYAYGGLIGDKGSFSNAGKFVTATAIKSITEAAINKYAEDNPSVWSRVMSPIAKSAVNQMFTAPKPKDGAASKLTRFVNGLRTRVFSMFKGIVNFAMGLFEFSNPMQRESGTSAVLSFDGLKDGENYLIFDLMDDLEHEAGALVQALASHDGISTLQQNWVIAENQSLQLAMTEDGERSYLMGDAGYEALKGEALFWFDKTGYGVDDKVEMELNLKTGDLFMFLDVKDVVSIFDAAKQGQREDLSNLRQIVTDSVGSIDKLNGLEIIVKINRNDSEIVGAVMRVDPSDIKDTDLLGRANEYLADNFKGLRQGQFDLILDVDLKSSEIGIRGISLNLDETSVNTLLDNLKEQTPELRQLAHEIKTLVDLVGGELKIFEQINLVINEKRDYLIHAKVRSDDLMRFPGLMSKLSIKENSPAFNRLSKREFTDFMIYVKTGAYVPDASLKCQKFETVFLRVGDIVGKKDYKGRVVSEDIYDKAGNLIMK